MSLSIVAPGRTEQRSNSDGLTLPDSFIEPHWYAAYTRAQHEKRVAAELGMREVKHFLPLYSSMRRWKDRRGQLETPFFSGCVFGRRARPAPPPALPAPVPPRPPPLHMFPAASPSLPT